MTDSNLNHGSEANKLRRGNRRIIFGLATVTLMILLSLAVVRALRTSPPATTVQLILPQAQVSELGVVTNQVLIISNSLKHAVSVSCSFQIRSNDVWLPAPEELFRHPEHPLRPQAAVGFSVPSPSAATWRFVVLQQKTYGESWFGEIAEAFDRWKNPEKFAKTDHRGVEDVFLFSEELGGSSGASD